MSKAYPSNLTRAQYEFLSDLLPAPKPGGRPREVELWAVLNAIFYVLVEGVRWRALPGDLLAWQTVYTYLRHWRKDGTWVKVHDHLREFTRIEQARQPSPTLREASYGGGHRQSKCQKCGDGERVRRLGRGEIDQGAATVFDR